MSEYVRELLREAQKRAARERVKALLLEGLNSEAIPMDEGFWTKLNEEAEKRWATHKGKRA